MLLYVPITLNYLNSASYGIWMTLSSIVAWMGVFDIGLGNGLRNKLTEALATGDKETAKKYVSTAYAMLSLLVLFVIIIFFVVNNWINWDLVLNTSESNREELKTLALVIVSLFGIKFVLNLIVTVFTADQLPAIGGLFEVIGSGSGLFVIWILTQTNKSSLISFGLATMLTPVVIYLAASIYFYQRRYSYLKPSFNCIDLSRAKALTGLGVQFFGIQISVLIIFQTSNILIAHYFSPSAVTPYNIIYRYFSIVSMLWGIIMLPFWSAYTNAWANQDKVWIKKVLLKILIGYLCLILFTAILYIFRNIFIKIWLGGKSIDIDDKLTLSVVVYVLICAWNNIFAFFLNGIGKIRLSLYFSILSAALIFPLNYFFINVLHFGVSGVVMSINFSLVLGSVIGPIQSYLIINNKARGVWNR